MTELLSISPKACRKCGFCAAVCPNKIIYKDTSGKMAFVEDRVRSCIGCGQCMAVCPTCSININGLSYGIDFPNLPKKAISPDLFFDMISTRRAERNFQDRQVPKSLLERIAKAIASAPPSFTPIKTEIIIVQDQTVIKRSLKYIIDFYDYLVKSIDNPVIKFIIRMKSGRETFNTLMNHVIPLMKDRLPDLKSGKADTITRNAPAMILFHADRNAENYKADIHIALTYAFLAAHALGLGACVVDLIPPAVDKNKDLRKLFGIPEANEVTAALILGYPKFKYLRGIKRDLRSIKWS